MPCLAASIVISCRLMMHLQIVVYSRCTVSLASAAIDLSFVGTEKKRAVWNSPVQFVRLRRAHLPRETGTFQCSPDLSEPKPTPSFKNTAPPGPGTTCKMIACLEYDVSTAVSKPLCTQWTHAIHCTSRVHPSSPNR